jgi:hypothetical protein
MRTNTSDYSSADRARQEALPGYVQLVDSRIGDGWSPYLATMMFERLPGDRATLLRTMFDEAERVYRTFVTRVVRRPLSAGSLDQLPIMVVAPDLPVGKRGKPLEQVAVNDGLHLHGVLLIPPLSRLRLSADEHFRQRQPLYVRDRDRLRSVEVLPIEQTVGCAVEYALKSVRRRRFSLDDVLVLPRARSELSRARRSASAC